MALLLGLSLESYDFQYNYSTKTRICIESIYLKFIKYNNNNDY